MISAIGIVSALFLVLVGVGSSAAHEETKEPVYMYVALLAPFLGVTIAFLAGVYSHLA